MSHSSNLLNKASRFLRASVLLALAITGTAAWSQATTPQGRWITASGNLEVEITACGDGLCGLVTKVLGNRSMSREGEEMKAADTRPALGMKILNDFKPDDTENNQTVRWKGEIYNRENGKTYSCHMSLGPNGELVLRPYIGLPLFGKTQIWQHAPTTSSQL
jgi:uncharacterized protein (DUF2147 family)